MTVAGGAPSLVLNNGGSAKYMGGSSTNTLTFKYTVGSTDKDVPALAISALNLPAGAKTEDGAGNLANMAAAMTLSHGPALDPSVVTTQTKTDGSSGIANFDVAELSYTSYEDIYNSASHTRRYPRSDRFGEESTAGLLASEAFDDVIAFSLTTFKGSPTNTATQNWDALVSSGAVVPSGANVTITDAAHDTLTLNNITTSMLSDYAGNVLKFVQGRLSWHEDVGNNDIT